MSESTELIGSFVCHETSDLDLSIYFDLFDYKFFTYLLFYYSLFQLIVLSGLTIISPIISIVTVIFCSMVYFHLKPDNIALDTKYEKVYNNFQIYLIFVTCLLCGSILDAILTFGFSKDKFKVLFGNKATKQQTKFGIFILGIMFSKVVLFIILCLRSFMLNKKILSFMISKKE